MAQPTSANASHQFQLVPFYSLLQRIQEKIHSSAYSQHLWERLLSADAGLREGNAWALMSTGFKTPPRVVKVLTEAHNGLRNWVNTLLFPKSNDGSTDSTTSAVGGDGFNPAQLDRSLMAKNNSTYRMTLTTFRVLEVAASETGNCAERGLAALNKFIDDEKETGSEARAQILAFRIRVEEAVDSYLSALCPIIGCALFAELLGLVPEYTQQVTRASKLASHFLRLFLPLCQRTLDSLLGQDQKWLARIFLKRSDHNVKTDKERRLVMKVRLFDSTLASLDLFLFPKTFQVHEQGGIKCLAAAHRRAGVVATASFDGTIILYGFFQGNGAGDGEKQKDDDRSKKEEEEENKRSNEDSGLILGHLRGHKSLVTWCAFSPSDHHLYSTSFDGTVRMWETATGNCLRVGRAHTDSILDADLSMDGKRLCTCSMDTTVRVWRTTTMECTHTFKGHELGSWIKACCFSRSDRRVISAGLDKRIVCWDSGIGSTDALGEYLSTKGALRIIDGAHSDFILAVASHSRKKNSTSSSGDGSDGSDGSGRSGRSGGSSTKRRLGPVATDDGEVDMVASISKDGTVTVWNMEAAEGSSCSVATLSMPHGASCWPCCLAFSNDATGSLIAVGCINNIVLIFGTTQHNFQMQRQLRVMNSGILCVRFTPSNDALLVGTVDGTIQLLPL